MWFWRNAELLAMQLKKALLGIMGFWTWETVWSQQQLQPAETKVKSQWYDLPRIKKAKENVF